MPKRPRIVVVGAGFAGLEAIFHLRRRLGRRAELVLVSDQDHFLFRPDTIYIPFGKQPDRYRVPLIEAVSQRQIELLQTRAIGVDPGRARLRTESGDVAYDQLLIATGARTRPGEVPGLAEHAITIWDPQGMLRLRSALARLVELARAGEPQRVLFVVPPMNRCSGPLYEIALMLDTWLRWQQARDAVHLRYTTCEPFFLQAFGPRLHTLLGEEFEARGVSGNTGKLIEAIEPGRAHYRDGDEIPFDLLISFPPQVAAVAYEGLPRDERGFLRTVFETRQVVEHPDLYALGDAGDFPVKQAFLALRQADAAAEHLAQRILGEEPDAAFDPVGLCILEQFDKATFAQVPLEPTGDPARPVRVPEAQAERYRVGTGPVWRLGKKLLGGALPARFRAGRPFHAGASWEAIEAGLKLMSAAFAD